MKMQELIRWDRASAEERYVHRVAVVDSSLKTVPIMYDTEHLPLTLSTPC